MEQQERTTYTQDLPLWAGRIVSPVKITDLSREHSFEGKLLWDTGAQMSVVSKCVAEACRLQTIPAGRTASLGIEPQDAWLGVVLVFPGNIRKFIPLHTIVMDDLHTDVDVILGMDVIGRGDFSIAHHGEGLRMTFVFGKDFIDA